MHSTDEAMNEETSTTTINSTKNNIYTPTQNSDSGKEDLLRLSMNTNSIERGATCPWREKTYVIIEKASKRAMALRYGDIVLTDTQGLINHFVDSSCHWHCSENEVSGWWGFRNAASGMFLGEGHTSYDNPYGNSYGPSYGNAHWNTAKGLGLLVASSRVHNESQWIHIKQHPDGGHELFVNRRNVLAPVTLGKQDTSDQKLTVGENGTPIRWDFIEV